MARKQNKKPIGKSGAKAGNRGNRVEIEQASALARAAADAINRGDFRTAAVNVQRGMSIVPDHPDLLHLAGQISLHTGSTDSGKELIRRAIKAAPQVGLYHYSLAAALFSEDDLDGAIKSLRQAIRQEPCYAEAYTDLGIVFVRKKQFGDADTAFSEAARLQPNDPRVHLNLAICNMELKNPEKAAVAIARVEHLVVTPEPQLLFQIGNIHRGLGQSKPAEAYYRRALTAAPGASDIWFELGELLLQTGDLEGAFEALISASRYGYAETPVKIALARVHAERGEIGQARALLEQALGSSGGNATSLNDIARQFTFIGDFAAQEKCLKQVLQIDPDNVAAYTALLIAPGRRLTNDDVVKLRKFAEDKAVDADIRRRIGFALGNHFRYAKQYDDSFRYYRLGNRMRGTRFDKDAYSLWVSQIERTFTKAFFDIRTSYGSTSRLPVLIVGMPRSGTTLTEQILSSHSCVFGAGEYGYASRLAGTAGMPFPDLRSELELIDRMTSEAIAEHAEIYLGKMRALSQHGEERVTNKLPHNFEQLGVFAMLFPKAPIIHVKRDPRDNLLSVYFQDFSSFHDYATDLKSLGHYYRLYERLMVHWETVLPNPIYALQYEELIADVPGKSRELAEFIGLEWDERMLSFYDQERKVDTASKWQVRQPIYHSAVGRWQPYERHLKPMFDALADRKI